MTAEKKAPILLWFRKDLRLSDNRALACAVSQEAAIIPVYIRVPDDEYAGALGSAQEWWLYHSLVSLEKSLKERGSALILKTGQPAEVLAELLAETGAKSIFWNRCYDPCGMEAGADIKDRFKDQGTEVQSFAGQLLHEPSRLKTKTGGPYRVYTPFWRALETGEEPVETLDAPGNIMSPDQWPPSEALPDWNLLPTRPNWAAGFSDLWEPGETAALAKLGEFTHSDLAGYSHGRDFPAKPATSLLSPHLALGEIAPARIWHATNGLSTTIDSTDVTRFRKELVWREFCYHLLYHFPKLDSDNWNGTFDAFEWQTDDSGFDAWTKGMTGYPIVDAGMRQLWKHGIMHNRVRMITASFLIKHLMIDWRRGEKWFRDTLVDADPACNPANWQWVAGCGADASPFFRIFNPILQGEKFDAEGEYIREFVPELTKLDKRYIHKPFEAPEIILLKAGVALGETYPKPVVDHATARQHALAAYKALKGNGESENEVT